jgi:Icc protein
MTFHIAQISDTHLSGRKPYFVANFEHVCESIRAGFVDLVINSGDITLNGAENDSDLAAARGLHDRVGRPVKVIPGNHDVGDNQDVPDGEHPIDADRRARYIRHFGPDWWQMDVPGWRLIGLDAQLIGSELEAAAEQDDFVEQAARTAGPRHVALFIHKPLCHVRMDENILGGRFLNPVPRRRLIEVFGGRSPRLIASGHVHQYRASIVDGTHHVWAPSSGYILPDSLQPRYGTKEIGYVAHRLHADGSHQSDFVRVGTAATLSILDFPEAYDSDRLHAVMAARVRQEG